MNISKKCCSEMGNIFNNFLKFLSDNDPYMLKVSLIESLIIDTDYGYLALRDISSLMSVDKRTIRIQPYDKSNIKKISYAIEKLNLGISINALVDAIIITSPVPSQEKREEIAKFIKTESEKYKVIIRGIRKKYNDIADTLNNASGIKKEIQKYTDNSIKDIDTNMKEKIKQILGK